MGQDRLIGVGVVRDSTNSQHRAAASNSDRSTKWKKIVAAANLPIGFRLDLMHRMRYGSVPAALIY